MEKIKVLHVCETMLGGVGTYQNELVSLQQKALGAERVAFLGPYEDLVQVPDIARESVHTFARPSRLSGLPNLAFAFVRLARLFRPDIVHIHSTFAGLIARPLAALMGIPAVYCPHGWATDRYAPSLKKKAVALIERILARLCARVIAVSDSERARGVEIGIPPEKIAVIRNGLRAQPPAFTPAAWTDERIKLLFVGRLDRQKGIDVFLKALKGTEDKLCARVIGDKVADGAAVSFKDWPHIEPLGWQRIPDVAAQMAVCDALVMPSRWEGLPLVALEAMRLSRPVIGSRVGGIPEAVVDGVTGFLFASEDHEALRGILLSLDKETCRATGQRAGERFQKEFTADRMCESVLALYRDVVRP